VNAVPEITSSGREYRLLEKAVNLLEVGATRVPLALHVAPTGRFHLSTQRLHLSAQRQLARLWRDAIGQMLIHGLGLVALLEGDFADGRVKLHRQVADRTVAQDRRGIFRGLRRLTCRPGKFDENEGPMCGK